MLLSTFTHLYYFDSVSIMRVMSKIHCFLLCKKTKVNQSLCFVFVFLNKLSSLMSSFSERTHANSPTKTGTKSISFPFKPAFLTHTYIVAFHLFLLFAEHISYQSI